MRIQYFLYFLFGGIITSGVTYLAHQSKGLLAAFVGTLPLITISTFVLIHFHSGQGAVLAYAKGLIVMIFPWMVFILSVIFLMPRIAFIYALLAGFCLQLAAAFLIFALSGDFLKF
ncbi:MAG: hypothetical protein FD156_1935 [Nitrospirae bacterium]|nr:MAG: hypothetical protein FD156_1935 [Nitrospirota bacterium]